MEDIRTNSLINLGVIKKRGGILRDLLRRYACEQPKGIEQILPGVAALYESSPVFRGVVESPLSEDLEDPVTAEPFADAMKSLPDLARMWREAHSRKLMELLPKDQPHLSQDEGLVEAPNSFHQLELATSLFTCKSCTYKKLHYVNALAHLCDFGLDSQGDKAILQELRAETDSCHPNNISFDSTASRNAKHLVELCGLDPKTATAQDMDERDDRFIDNAGAYYDGRKISYAVLNWRQAVSAAICIEF
jgi:hypothetical protein